MAKILVIDDDPSVRAVVEMVLRRAGHDVTAASNGAEGINLFQTLSHHLVIADIEMPGISGLDACKAIKALSSSGAPPVIIMTGRPLEEIPTRAQEAGADHLIYKPFDRQDLLSIVNRLLAENP